MAPTPKVLLLDEDKSFAQKLKSGSDWTVHWRRSLSELGSIGRLGDYDLLLVEPLLGPVSGLEIAEYAAAFFPGLPVLLVGDREVPLAPSRWPASVAGYLCKDTPVAALAAEINKRLETARPLSFRAPPIAPPSRRVNQS